MTAARKPLLRKSRSPRASRALSLTVGRGLFSDLPRAPASIPQPVVFPLGLRDRVAGLVLERQHLGVVGRGLAHIGEPVPAALGAIGPTGRGQLVAVGLGFEAGRALGAIDRKLLLALEALHRLAVADLLEPRLRIEAIERLLKLHFGIDPRALAPAFAAALLLFRRRQRRIGKGHGHGDDEQAGQRNQANLSHVRSYQWSSQKY